MKLIAVFAHASSLVLCLAAGVAAQGVEGAAAAQAPPSKTFQQVVGTPPGAPAAFEFELNGFSYHVAANGNGRRTKGDKTRRFNLRLDTHEEIRRLSFSEYEGDLLLLCEFADADGGACAVQRLEQPSMRARWKQHAPSSGVNALREDGSLYLAGRGFVARLDLRTGEYVWRHGGSNDDEDEELKEIIPPGFYAAPEVSGDTVTFREDQNLNKPPLKTVQVYKKSGKIIRIE
jgi:hypothetical protein